MCLELRYRLRKDGPLTDLRCKKNPIDGTAQWDITSQRCIPPCTALPIFEGFDSASSTCQIGSVGSTCSWNCTYPYIASYQSSGTRAGSVTQVDRLECVEDVGAGDSKWLVESSSQFCFVPCLSEVPVLDAAENLQCMNTPHQSTCDFECRPGFKLLGDPTLTCYDGGWQSQGSPTCVSGCNVNDLNIPDMQEASTFVEHNATFNYACKSSYKKEGADSVRCLDGQWILTNEVCRKPCIFTDELVAELHFDKSKLIATCNSITEHGKHCRKDVQKLCVLDI